MDRFVLDCETWLIAPGRLAPRLVSVAYACDGDLVSIRHRLDDWQTPIRDGLAAREIVGHNVAFDLAVLITADPSLAPLIWRAYDEGRVRDTMIRAQLVAIALGRLKFDPTIGPKGGKPRWTLAALVERFLGGSVEGKHGPDVWRLRYHELDEVAVSDWPDAARKYALNDVDWTRRLWIRLQRFAEQAGFADDDVPDEAAQVRGAWSLHLAACWGVRTDGDRVADLERRLRASVAEAHERARALGWIRPTGSKNLAAIRAAVDCAYMGAPPLTAKGAISTATAVLAESGDDDLVALAEVAGDEKELSAFVPTLHAGVTRPINPRWNVLVESGRVSCSAPNLTQQPRRPGVRECYVPRPRYLYATADYSFAELCTLAQICVDWFGSSRLAETINAGRDPHKATGATILDITYEEMNTRYRSGDPAAVDARQLAKACNFGYPSGLGASVFITYARTTYGLEIEEEQARELKDAFVRAYPEISAYWSKISSMLSAGGGTFTGALVRSKRRRGGLGFPNGCNYYYQGPVADAAKAALYLVTREAMTDPASPLFGSRPVILMHDEIIAEVPEDKASAAAARLADVMIETLSDVCPDVKNSAEPALMRRWYKGAAPVRVDGELVPWEPS